MDTSMATRLAIAAWVIFATGCMGSTTEATNDIVDSLIAVPASEWTALPVGCEGALSEDVRFAVAEGAPDLLVTTDAVGIGLCVDTLEAIEDELDVIELVDDEEFAAQLRVRYLLTLDGVTIVALSDTDAIEPPPSGEPQPQPSHDTEPQPQPSGQPEPQPQPSGQPEPQPQPSGETDSSSGVQEPQPQPSNDQRSSGSGTSQPPLPPEDEQAPR